MIERLYDLAIETRALYRAGAISRKEAKDRISPYEEYYNQKVKGGYPMEYFEIMDTNLAELREWEEFEADMASNPFEDPWLA